MNNMPIIFEAVIVDRDMRGNVHHVGIHLIFERYIRFFSGTVRKERYLRIVNDGKRDVLEFNTRNNSYKVLLRHKTIQAIRLGEWFRTHLKA